MKVCIFHLYAHAILTFLGECSIQNCTTVFVTMKDKATLTTKSGPVNLRGIRRREAVSKLLAILDLQDQYMVLDDGPPFTFYTPGFWYVVLSLSALCCL